MKRQNIKRICSALLLAVLLITTTASCNRSYDEEEVISAAGELLRSAEILNYVYYGEGIKYYDTDESIGVYKEAQSSHLDELGFHSIEELKTLTEKTFSKEYSAIMYSSVLDTMRDGENIVGYKRYYDNINESGKNVFMVNTAYQPLFKSTIVYNYDSIEVDRVKKEKVFLKVSATVINSEGQSREVDIAITLIEEEAGWRIDNPVWANY